MTTSNALSLKPNNRWLLAPAGIFAFLVVFAIARPHLMRLRMVADQSVEHARESIVTKPLAGFYEPRAKPRQMSSDVIAAVGQVEPVPRADSSIDRKMIRTSSIDLIVLRPSEAAEKIRALAENMGGFLVSSEISGGQNANATLTIRVPAARFEEARAAIRKLGLRLESEKVEAQDVTRQYVDQQASLRNLRAEEAQYLAILKHAGTVKDTLEVSEKLSEVRGQIDQQQAEFDALSKQVETVAITVSLRAEAETQVFGLHWRPLYQMKLALRDGLDAVADYSASMTSLVFYLPAILLWTVTIVIAAAVSWKVLRWVARRFFAWPKQPAAQNG